MRKACASGFTKRQLALRRKDARECSARHVAHSIQTPPLRAFYAPDGPDIRVYCAPHHRVLCGYQVVG